MSEDYRDSEQYDPVFGTAPESRQGEELKNYEPGNQVIGEEASPEMQPPKKGKARKIIRTIIILCIGIIAGMWIAFALLLSKVVTVGNSSDTISSIENDSIDGSNSKLSTLISLIKTYYYQDVDDETLVNGIYKGLLESMGDPYTEYYTADEYESLMTTLTGNYCGIGALLSKNADTGVVTVTKVYADTPAEEAGIKAGDIIESADGYAATDESLDTFVQHIRGEEGTTVSLVIVRDGEELTFEPSRRALSTPTVEHQMLDDNMGYIQISQFTESTYEDFVAAYEDLESQGMTSVIFDMRNNGGGLLDSVVDVLDYLLPEGTVVYTEDKNGNREDYTSDATHYKSIPMTVLVNGNTASAAEIFTGALRDFNYATIIGTNTFGKGIVQSTIPLADGSAVKITTSSYFTPSGECIHGVGIAPDVELEYEFLGGEDDDYDVSLDNQIQKAIEVLQGQATK